MPRPKCQMKFQVPISKTPTSRMCYSEHPACDGESRQGGAHRLWQSLYPPICHGERGEGSLESEATGCCRLPLGPKASRFMCSGFGKRPVQVRSSCQTNVPYYEEMSHHHGHPPSGSLASCQKKHFKTIFYNSLVNFHLRSTLR